MTVRMEEGQLNAVMDKLYDGVLVTDADGMIILCNEKAASNYMTSKNRLEKSHISYLMETGIIDQSFWKLAAETKKPVTYEQICKSGKRLINKTIPVTDSRKNIRFIIEQTYSVEEFTFETNMPVENVPALKQAASQQSDTMAAPMVDFKSPAMMQVYNLADNMAHRNINILILGSSGTGKSQLAKRIHNNSTRKNGPFITVNCSTIPENLLESELFGYMKGAFSGANDRGKQGIVELADGGTLFLDEIGEIPINLQAKFLQLVQEKTYLPVGGVHPRKVDTRIIAATNKDLFAQVKKGMFREDLYYRLSVVTITLPPLHERKEDIVELISYFTHVFNHKYDMDVVFSKNTTDILKNYSWPGNIRELEHLVEYLVLNTPGEYVMPSMLPEEIQKHKEKEIDVLKEADGSEPVSVIRGDLSEKGFSDFPSLEAFHEHFEAAFIRELYPKYKSSYKLAERLKISQTKASRLIRKYVK